jgi:alpha-L-rhamnosidase
MAHVIVHDTRGHFVWDSGTLRTPLPEIVAEVPLRSRTDYRWRVRLARADGNWGDWSNEAEWECPLLAAPDWNASWIARAAPPSSRVTRAIERGWIDWAGPGDEIEQEFATSGHITSVSFDLVGERDSDVAFGLRLVDDTGHVVANREVDGPQHVWERFLHFIEITPPAPPGLYRAGILVHRGRVGWHTAPNRDWPLDDGVSPLPVIGRALRDGQPVEGIRATGIDAPPAANPVFRSAFRVSGPVVRARLYATALGNGRIAINGRWVGDGVLDPAPTRFDARVLYGTWDVAALMRDGENEIRIEAGRGTFAARGASAWAWHLAPWHREPMAIARLEWQEAAGATRVVATDERWETAPGDVVTDLLYAGEASVSRRVDPPWSSVTIVPDVRAALVPTYLPSIRRGEPILPTASTDLGPRRRIYDFGATTAGFVVVRARASAGSGFRVRSGEELALDGRVVVRNELAVGPSQLDSHHFERDAQLDWTQSFGYRGFRWVEVESYGDIRIDDVVARPAHTAVPDVGQFATDEPVLAWWDGAMRRTFLNNLHGIPTDTPIYEKNGWTADAHLSTEALLQHFDLRDTFGKWLDDHADAQLADGSVPQIVPSPGWGHALDPAWSASTVIIPWQLYWEYGDLGILRRAEPMVRRYLDAVLAVSDGRTWPLRSWGDWLPPGHKFAPEGPAPTATMMMCSVLQYGARLLAELGDLRDAEAHMAAAGRIGDAYHNRYFDPSSQTYRVPGLGYRQTMNALPLAFGTVPGEHRDRVARGLARDIEERTEHHLDVGAIGARHLLHVLSEIGRDDLAVSVATNRTAPGWGAWFEAGESTLLESWDMTARSRNHYFLGAALSWVHQRVGAARATAPGWRRFEVDPVDDPRISSGTLAHRTILGMVTVSWRRGKGTLDVELSVPHGAAATVAPRAEAISFGPGQHYLRLRRG